MPSDSSAESIPVAHPSIRACRIALRGTPESVTHVPGLCVTDLPGSYPSSALSHWERARVRGAEPTDLLRTIPRPPAQGRFPRARESFELIEGVSHMASRARKNHHPKPSPLPRRPRIDLPPTTSS